MLDHRPLPLMVMTMMLDVIKKKILTSYNSAVNVNDASPCQSYLNFLDSEIEWQKVQQKNQEV